MLETFCNMGYLIIHIIILYIYIHIFIYIYRKEGLTSKAKQLTVCLKNFNQNGNSYRFIESLNRIICRTYKMVQY